MKNFLLVTVMMLTSCASITRGVDNDVSIQYNPADATVTTSLDHRCTSSPCTVNVPRKKTFQVIAKRDGYKTEIVDVRTKVSGSGAAGFAGNVVLGGAIGMGVDAATGATLDHYPNPVIINLQPLNGAAEENLPVQQESPATTPDSVEAVPTS